MGEKENARERGREREREEENTRKPPGNPSKQYNYVKGVFADSHIHNFADYGDIL